MRRYQKGSWEGDDGQISWAEQVTVLLVLRRKSNCPWRPWGGSHSREHCARYSGTCGRCTTDVAVYEDLLAAQEVCIINRAVFRPRICRDVSH